MSNSGNNPFNRREFIQGALAGAALAAIPVPSFAAGNADMQTVLAQVPKMHDENVKHLQEWIALPSIAAENRNTAYVTLGLIAAMIRSFIVGNFVIGLFLSAASTAAFGLMGLPYFYFLGVISGFLSLIPYLGVMLALLPPVIVGLGYLTTTTFVLTCFIVVGLHLFAMNVLYPMVLGKRLQLNPLAVTISLLFWGWLWGAMGLILAVPLTGALKIICDNIERLRPYGAWMGE